MLRHKKTGFTLLELSIVLVIIAIILGSVVVTQSMLRDAQIRNVMSEAQRHIQAIAEFRDKYRALPGDFSGATALWGTATGGCPNGTGTGTQTCNGDGNGRIGDQTNVASYEEFRAWQHLINAELVEASVTGVTGSGGYHDRIPGTNIPASQLSGAGWGLTCITSKDIAGIPITDIPDTTGDIPPNHLLWLGGRSSDGSANAQAVVLKPEEALRIDEKLDDGKPNTGKVIAQINPSLPLCSTDSAAATADYNFSKSDLIICSLVFKTGF